MGRIDKAFRFAGEAPFNANGMFMSAQRVSDAGVESFKLLTANKWALNT